MQVRARARYDPSFASGGGGPLERRGYRFSRNHERIRSASRSNQKSVAQIRRAVVYNAQIRN